MKAIKKVFFASVMAGIVFLASCGGKKDAPVSVIPDPLTITIDGRDDMKFSSPGFKAKAGQEIRLTLKITGTLPKEAMGHNLVVLKPGTDVEAFSQAAAKEKSNDYIPAALQSSIVAHTKLLGPGESDTIIFEMDSKGVYPFVCTFPGHGGSMNGKITID